MSTATAPPSMTMNGPDTLFDSNVWVALSFLSHPAHGVASAEIDQATDSRRALFCRSTEQSFLRLMTTPALIRLYGAEEMTNALAVEALHGIRQSPRVGYRDEPDGLTPLWHRLAGRPVAAPKLWMDAYLAAFAIAGGLMFATFDKDFKAFVSDGLDLRLLQVQ